MVPARNVAAVLLFVLVTACAQPSRAPSSRGPTPVPAPVQPQALGCLLQAPEHVGLGEPVVPVTYTLHNEGPVALRVLARHTPLEGILGDIFVVEYAGQRLEYRGRMVKRGPPGDNEFVTLEPGDHLRATVDLLEGYDLSRAGQYSVRYAGADGYTCNELRITRD